MFKETNGTAFFAVRDNAFFQKTTTSEGSYNFIRNPIHRSWATKFSNIGDLVTALRRCNVKGLIKIYEGNYLHCTYKGGLLCIHEKPVKQFI